MTIPYKDCFIIYKYVKYDCNLTYYGSQVLQGHYSTMNNIVCDYCDSLQYKSHPLFSTDPLALQIMFFYDELELCNPLGSSTKVHKLGKQKF